MSHEESFEEESSDGSTKLTHSIFSGPTEDYTCALNNGVKALVGDWSGLLGLILGGNETEIELFVLETAFAHLFLGTFVRWTNFT